MTGRSGQTLIVHLVSITFLVMFFLHMTATSKELIRKHEMKLATDLTALSTARVQAEFLQALGAINDIMLKETQFALVTAAAPFVAAATIVGIPLVPFLANTAAHVVPRILKSLRSLHKIEKKLISAYRPAAVWLAWEIARENKLEGAVPIRLKPLPVSQNKEKFLNDLLTFSLNYSKSAKQSSSVNGSIIKSILNRSADKAPSVKTGNAKKDIETNRELKKAQKVSRKLSIQNLPVPFYLDDRWHSRKIILFCWDQKDHFYLSAAESTHTLFNKNEVAELDANLYIGLRDSHERPSGFQVRWQSIGNILKTIPQLDLFHEKWTTISQKIGVQDFFRREHLNPVQH